MRTREDIMAFKTTTTWYNNTRFAQSLQLPTRDFFLADADVASNGRTTLIFTHSHLLHVHHTTSTLRSSSNHRPRSISLYFFISMLDISRLHLVCSCRVALVRF